MQNVSSTATDRDALSALAAALRRLPGLVLKETAAERTPYECDGLTAYRALPGLVALPADVAQLRAVLAQCRALRVPVVARGAGTGLSGGALPLPQGLLLGLSRLNRILAIDPVNRIARVEPGVRNLAVSQAAAPHGLYYAPDPSSQIACSVGGNVAENSGGVHCLKYGLTVHNVLGVKLMTLDGEEHVLGGAAFDAPGYDLLALVHGSEGLLGLVTEVTVRLVQKPEHAAVILAAFADIESAGAAVGAIMGAGIVPAGLEMMDRLAIQAAEAYAQVGYPATAAAILLCELDGTATEVEEQMTRVEELLRAAGATSLRRSASEAERLSLWAGRKAAFPAVGRLAPDYYCMDGTIPRRRLPEVLRAIERLSAQYGLPVANVFHAGDGNLHPLILYDANRPDELLRAERMGADILALCVAVDGTITGEHGVGVEKLAGMCTQFSAAELTQMRAVKAAFDPLGLLNPGKAVPTPARCAEFGAMHVHGGALAHPDLERF